MSYIRVACVAATAAAMISCSSSSSDAPAKASLEQGSTFPALSLTGYVDRNHDGALTADEYGPLRPADVQAAYPNAELVLVHLAFEWCKYCAEETDNQLAMLHGYGGRFISLQIMAQDSDGHVATHDVLDRWVRKHKSSLVTTLEPDDTLHQHFGNSATYLLLDPKDGLRILSVGAGPPQFSVVKKKIQERLGALPDSPVHGT